MAARAARVGAKRVAQDAHRAHARLDDLHRVVPGRGAREDDQRRVSVPRRTPARAARVQVALDEEPSGVRMRAEGDRRHLVPVRAGGDAIGHRLGERPEPPAELEENSYRWRSGRLADLGYVDFYEALDLFRPLDADKVFPRDILHVARSRFLWENACYERLRVTNYGLEPAIVLVVLRFGADFADIFEVRGTVRPRRGRLHEPECTEGSLVLVLDGIDHPLEASECAVWPSSHAHTVRNDGDVPAVALGFTTEAVYG